MTVREHLNKKIAPVLAIMLACFALFAVCGLVTVASPSLMLLAFIPFFGFGACILYLFYGIPCPSCHNPVGYLMYMGRGSHFRISRSIRFCPFCGLEMDSELATKGEGQQLNPEPSSAAVTSDEA